MMRDIDMINVTAADMQLLINKCNFYASQVQDPAIRHLLQDAARLHHRHVATLSAARSQLQQQLGGAQLTAQQVAGGLGSAAGQAGGGFGGQAASRWTQ